MDSQTLERDLRTYRPAAMEGLPAPFVWPATRGSPWATFRRRLPISWALISPACCPLCSPISSAIWRTGCGA
jgi:hypothetical protein